MLEARQIVWVVGVGKLFHVKHGVGLGRHPVENKVGPDKAVVSVDQN